MGKKSRITKRTQAEILFLLGKLLNNGFSLSNSINCLSLKYPQLQLIFRKMKQSLNSGNNFSSNMRLLNLSEMMISQLELAEQNGLLKKVILQIGQLMAIKNKQAKKIQLLMIYPMFIFVFLIIIMAFIKTFFTFEYERTALSFWLEVSDWLIIGAVIIGILYLAYQLITVKKSSESAAVTKKIKLPIFGGVYRCYYEYNLLFSIGLMIKSGLKVADMCELKFTQDSSYQQLQRHLIKHLRMGGDLPSFIQRNQLIPNELGILTASGLDHANLGNEILALAQIKYDETLEKAQKMITKIQPIVFGIIAIMILNTYLKILVPVYGMMEGMY